MTFISRRASYTRAALISLVLGGLPTLPAGAQTPRDARARMEQQLEDARRAWLHTPDNADSVIWYGRRTAYLGQYAEAVRIFGDGLAAHPDDARLLRHRGHRWITLRTLDSAVADLSRAAALVQGQADVVEPDGQPNARNIPTSTLQTNIYYHLGLAHYLRGEFDDAVAAWQACLERSHNNDMRIATQYWLYLGLRQAGREHEADAIMATIKPGMEVIENGSYYRLMLVYKGALDPDSLVPPDERGDTSAGSGSLGDVTTGYGLAAFHLLEGRTEAGRATLRHVLAQRSQSAAFGYIAAEAELKRLESRDPP